MSFVDEPPDQRVNQERARQVLETGADVVAVGCPFCMTMLEDGVNARKGDRDDEGHGRGRAAVASITAEAAAERRLNLARPFKAGAAID